MKARHSFDDSNISWYSPEAFAGSSIYVLDVDPLRKTYEFLLKLPPRDKIALHRHLTDTKTFVVEGEHYIYEPDGSFRERRATPAATPRRTAAARRIARGPARPAVSSCSACAATATCSS